MSQNPPADTWIGNYNGHPIYVEDVLGAYAPRGIPIEDRFAQVPHPLVFESSKGAYFRVPVRKEKKESERSMGILPTITVTTLVDWREYIHVPVNVGIVYMFTWFQKNLQDIYEKKGQRIRDGFGYVMCRGYPKMYKSYGFRVDTRFWQHHVEEIFKSDPNGPGDLSKYLSKKKRMNADHSLKVSP